MTASLRELSNDERTNQFLRLSHSCCIMILLIIK